ncbi:hybrid sensor histidine kinase/response regulator transcription factor [Hwangdonia lutea]|uniref:histidine kinase n=1 Tax=Hwangdonia lutea TaxID=3075823 RepID=A0AA97HQQ0_9FLAO|nr:two-component regulator propeller domain-containing protein [Hwangdonia sp. SCSIO 19198]WOD43802.1 two-component regulator propeller domain-containing protein [Hwangdonia sp. SCSIO 19198]
MKLVLSILFVCLLQNLSAQNNLKADSLNPEIKKQIAYSQLSIKDGLSQNSVISIAQDSIGYMWFATQDGLNKYNGRSFKIYNKQFEDITRPTYSRLGKLYIDKKNKFWIITNSGKLELYMPNTDSFKAIERFSNVSTIFQDENHNTYVGTYGSGLFKINAISKDTIQLLNPIDIPRTINAFHQINDEIIVATSGAILSLNKNNNYKNLTQHHDANTTNYSAIAQTQDGTLWIGSYSKGLYYKNVQEDIVYPFTNDASISIPNSLNIQNLLVDDKDRLWIATYGHGAYLVDFKQNKTTNFLENKTNPFAIQYNDILSLYEDNTGVIWLGTDGAGANYYDEHLVKFNVLTNKQMPKSVNIDVVRSICTDPHGNMWVGTSGKGLTFVNNNKNIYKTISTSNSDIASNRIISLSYYNESLWIGHQVFGLNIMEPSGRFKYFPEISNYSIWHLLPETPEQTWLCTEKNGLVLFDKNKGIVEKYNINNSALTSNNIKTVVRGNLNELWLGTENQGVFKLNLSTKHIEKLKGINGPIKSLLFKDGVLWIGTAGRGLKQYHTKLHKTSVFTTENGLPNNVIYGILPDDNNNLWLSSNGGLTKFSLTQNPETIIVENYNNYDGLQALEFNTGAYFKSPNGTLYFGGLEGVNWFHPNQISFNKVKPKTIISTFEIYNKNQPLIQNKTYKYNQNTVTFTFSSLHYSQPERNLYKYKLENHDTDWSDSNNTNTAHYTNLPPNDYVFKVISSNYDGVWNEVPATYAFTILKPWYINTTAKVIYGLLLLLILFLTYKYFKWRWQLKLQLELEHAETNRLKDLDEFKTKLYTNISHEFRTPLTLILGPTENQLAKKNIGSADKKELSLIHRNAKRLLNLVNQLMDLAKLETGHLKLNVENDNLSILLKQIASSFQYRAEKKGLHFKTNISNISKAWFDKDIVEKIVTNLLANAVKYTPKNGHIYFNTEQQNNYAILTIINSGSTIKPEDLSKLFTRFYQVNSNADGVGIGLALVKELVALTHGSLVTSTVNKDEIQFTVTLPINKEAFNKEDITPDKNNITKQQSSEISNELSENTNESSEKPVLLIVEDDKNVRQYIASILEPNYKIIKASNGKIGIKKALETIPDIIISDIMMPVTNGIELCHSLKNNMLTSHIPIILLTAKVGEENELKGLEAGADDFITKPFKSKILIKRIENLIELRKSLQSRYSQHNISKNKDIATTTFDEDFLNKIEGVLNEHLSNPDFNAAKFSKLMLVSRMQLHRKLVALTGLTTTAFIRSQRLKMAVSLLQKSDYTISEIAYQVGFNTPSYFIKCFKKAYHCTPNDYINKI